MVIYHFSSILNSNSWLNTIILLDLTEVFIKAITHMLGWKFVFYIRHITEYWQCQWMFIFFIYKEGQLLLITAKICFQSHFVKKVFVSFILDKQCSFDLLSHVWILNSIEFLFSTSMASVCFWVHVILLERLDIFGFPHQITQKLFSSI